VAIEGTVFGIWGSAPYGDFMGILMSAVVAVLVVLPVVGCAASGEGPSSGSPGARLPYSVLVDDGKGGKVDLQIAPVVEGGTLSSGFGWRGHAMGGGSVGRHQGIDIVASKGTPVRAAADGTIVDVGPRGAYGRFVLVRHTDGIETAYAHLSRFAPDLKAGRTVQQGEIIGFVGSTGRSNAPHLHYELRKDGKAVDPLSFPPVRR
jgi:murein DD-endopeptidase MepM/ murein hydrolase activator NlpD